MKEEPIIIDNLDNVIEETNTYWKYHAKFLAVEGQIYKVEIPHNNNDAYLSVRIRSIESQEIYTDSHQKYTSPVLKFEIEYNRMIEIAKKIKHEIIKEAIEVAKEKEKFKI